MTIENGIEKADKIAENKIADETLRTTLEKPEGFKEWAKQETKSFAFCVFHQRTCRGEKMYFLCFR